MCVCVHDTAQAEWRDARSAASGSKLLSLSASTDCCQCSPSPYTTSLLNKERHCNCVNELRRWSFVIMFSNISGKRWISQLVLSDTCEPTVRACFRVPVVALPPLLWYGMCVRGHASLWPQILVWQWKRSVKTFTGKSLHNLLLWEEAEAAKYFTIWSDYEETFRVKVTVWCIPTNMFLLLCINWSKGLMYRLWTVNLADESKQVRCCLVAAP